VRKYGVPAMARVEVRDGVVGLVGSDFEEAGDATIPGLMDMAFDELESRAFGPGI
jgi:hypothetical protein